jgi:hypothetical protein
MIRAALLAALAFAAPAAAEAPRLALPLDCRLGETCFIQQYVDTDPGPGAQDWTCGPLSYDGHKGTDFRLVDLAAMRAGVSVRAAAAGVVRAVRDGEPDIAQGAPGAPDVAGRECGNGVLVDHGDGWETQYCHLKSGSVAVAEGAAVEAGTALGEVGLSGETQFPHVHLSLRHRGAVIDPFAPGAAPGTCGTGGEAALWQAPVPYLPGGILSAGVTTAVPQFEELREGLAPPPRLPAEAPALVAFAYLYGTRAGDRLDLLLRAPDGRIVSQNTEVLERTQAEMFRAVGRKLRGAAWPAGRYTAEAVLVRDGAEIARLSRAQTVGP